MTIVEKKSLFISLISFTFVVLDMRDEIVMSSLLRKLCEQQRYDLCRVNHGCSLRQFMCLRMHVLQNREGRCA